MVDPRFASRYRMIYEFLLFCEDSELEKKVLDCGAGGPTPPLSIFKEQGYDTTGIDIINSAIESSRQFQKRMDLNIVEMDMREMTFDDESFSSVFSFNTIYHMTKKEMQSIIDDIFRVLMPGGKFYVNIMVTSCSWYQEYKHKSLRGEEGELYLEMGGQEVLHTFLSHEEADKMLDKFQIDKKHFVNTIRSDNSTYEEIHYFVQKPL